MRIDTSPYGLRSNLNVRLIRTTMVTAVVLLMAASVAHAQSQTADSQPQISKSPVIAIKLGPDQIATIKTGERLSTRLSFREPIKEVICGDLYDPASGTGSFVVQRIDRDVFIKPVASKGISNMFVKTGERGENIYNFSLVIVPSGQAYLIVKVVGELENTTAVKKANSRLPSMAPPITAKVAITDVVPNDASASITEGSLAILRSIRELREQPPPPTSKGLMSGTPKMAPTTSSVRPREPTKRVAAEYPESAVRARAAGDVLVKVTIDEKGKVKSARAISGHPLLIGSAVTAARSWRFNPVDNDDGQAQGNFIITFRFHGDETRMPDSPRGRSPLSDSSRPR